MKKNMIMPMVALVLALVMGTLLTIVVVDRQLTKDNQSDADLTTIPTVFTVAPSTFVEALEMAKVNDANLLIIFSADWCPPCVRMHRDVWSNQDIKNKLNNSFITYKVDVDKEPEVASQFDLTSIPAYGIYKVNAEDELVTKSESTGFKDVRQVLAWLDRFK